MGQKFCSDCINCRIALDCKVNVKGVNYVTGKTIYKKCYDVNKDGNCIGHAVIDKNIPIWYSGKLIYDGKIEG